MGWDANSEEDLAGYKLYYGSASRRYGAPIDVGNVTEYTITGLDNGVKYFIAATAYNDEGAESKFSKELVLDPISPEPLPLPQKACCGSIKKELLIESVEIVVDNGEAGTSFTGVWGISTGLSPYKESSLFNWNEGTRYTFEAAIGGAAAVSVWWTRSNRRCTAVPIDIYDGGRLLATVNVNQKNNGGQWNVIGNYVFSGIAKVVIRSEGPSCSTCADAVKISK